MTDEERAKLSALARYRQLLRRLVEKDFRLLIGAAEAAQVSEAGMLKGMRGTLKRLEKMGRPSAAEE